MAKLASTKEPSKQQPLDTSPCTFCRTPVLWAFFWEHQKNQGQRAIEDVAAGGDLALSFDLFGGHGQIPYAYRVGGVGTRFRLHADHCKPSIRKSGPRAFSADARGRKTR